ncbi:MAG: ComEC/Rec2 family competence protein [Bacteroidales bacterium]|nr:ComEC/Rec2 family competence protein [Bacteroidales bacterium]
MRPRPAPLSALLLGGAQVFGAFVFLKPSGLWICGSIVLIVLGWLSSSRKRTTILLTGLCVGLIVGYLHRPISLPSSLFDNQSRVWTGEVVQVSLFNKSQVCKVRLSNGSEVKVFVSGYLPGISVHDQIRFSGVLRRADEFESVGIPEISIRTSGENDLAGTISVAPLGCRIIGHNRHFTDVFSTFADDISRYIYSSGLDPESAGLLCSAWLGRDDVEPYFNSSVRALGLSHLLCVSGMHVGLMALVISMLILPLNYFRRSDRIRYGVVVGLVWIYVTITGLQPSAFRAAVMITVFYVIEILQYNRNTLNTLSLAASIVLVFNPWWIFAIGFQLSVMAVAGIAVFGPFLNPFTGTHHSRMAMIANAIVLPVAVTISTLPVVLYRFHAISLVSVPSNILAALIFPVFMFGGIIAVMLLHCGVSWAAIPVDAFADLLGSACEMGVRMTDGLYLSDLRFVLMLALLLGMTLLIRYVRRPVATVGVGICVVLTTCLAVMPYHRAREVVLYSNGQEVTALISGQEVPLYVSTMTHPRPIVPYRRYFALRGYDGDSLTLIPKGRRVGEIAVRDSLLILPVGAVNLNQLRKKRMGKLIRY